MINNFDEEVNNLLSFIGEEFDDNVKDYYKNTSTAFTPSYNQIIQKPYKDSIYRYKRYEEYLYYPKHKINKFIEWFEY